MLDRTRLGSHSEVFQAPDGLPATCPTRTTTERSGVAQAADSKTFSQTHLDSLYPFERAISGGTGSSFAALSAETSGRVSYFSVETTEIVHYVLVRTATELEKRIDGGVW